VAGDIVNGSFEDGLTGWRIVSGDAFWNQPVQAEGIGARDVLIDGRPPVTLGGDYWYTNAFPLGQDGSFLIRVVTEKDGIGVLDSVPFMITQRYLAYRLGGTVGGDAALEVRVPQDDIPRPIRGLDPPDEEGYVAVLVAAPDGSDILREHVMDFLGPDAPNTLIGMTAKLRLRVSDEHGPGRLLVSNLRQVGEIPARVRRPLWGWADIHCHPMAQAGSGDLLAGHIHGPVEDIGSCLEVHGHEHGNPLHLTGMFLDGGRHNDGSLPTTGWSTTATPGPEGQGFRGWPAFDELTHLKTHQDWIRRAYEGGLRLMVALVVHNQLLAALSTGLDFVHAQTDRDAIEPQVQMLHEFVAHNNGWCGLATTPDVARELIEDNKLAFVLGLETDTINGWSKFTDFPTVETDATRPVVRESIHEAIHEYFKYLHDLGIVQVNLIHLSDNAFGGMALYDFMFVVNTFLRSARVVEVDDGYLDQATGNPRKPGEAISLQVDVGSKVWQNLQAAAAKAGITAPDLKFTPVYGHGHRNKIGLLPAGEEAVLEAMRFGMVIDMDHMSEKATAQAYDVVTTQVPQPDPAQAGPWYPLVAAHNGARRLAMTPPAQFPLPGTTPVPGERRGPHTWPNESTKSDTQLDYIKKTGGMFGHGIAGADSKQHGGAVIHDAAGTSKTVAQGLQYVMDTLETPDGPIGSVGLGTDWNILLGGPGPRFGPMAVPGLEGEFDPDDDWAKAVRSERLKSATSQTHAVGYESPLRDWRSHRFPETGLYKGEKYELYGRFIWQALVLQDTGADLTSQAVVDALNEPGWGHPALDLARGLTNTLPPTGLPSLYWQAGAKSRDPAYPVTGTGDEMTLIMNLVTGITDIKVLWDRVKTSDSTAPLLSRSTAGPIRDFDYNLDGLGHYGMLPDMLQDMKNVGLPAERFTSFFASAERYIQVWERCVALAKTIPHPPVKTPGPGGGP
jgi:hypothetical protein